MRAFRISGSSLLLQVVLHFSLLMTCVAFCSGCTSSQGYRSGGGNSGPLTISTVTVANPSVTGATIDWQTNVSANSQVEYGLSTSYGSYTPLDSAMVTSHQENIANLKPSTLYHFRVHSADANSVTAVSADQTFTTSADTSPPVVSVTAPLPNATLSGTVSLVASATDNVAVASVQFKVDNANTGAPVTTPPYSILLNATTLSDGMHTITAVATDTSGNIATSSGVPVTVNNSVPPSTAGWTYLQDSITTGCMAGASSCTISVANGNMLPTIAGSVWVVIASTGNNVTISSVAGGGGAWSLCPSSGCHVYNPTLVRNVDAAYSLNGSAGTTSITVNISGASSGLLKVNFIELLPPSGSTASLDAFGTTSVNSCTTCTAVGLTLSATDAVVQFQGIHDPTGWNAWNPPYVTDTQGDGVYLNARSGALAAPTVAMSASGGIFTALAFKSTAGSFTPPMQPLSVVSFTNPQGVTCTPTCSLTIPPTGSGHLFYIEAANISSSYIWSVSGGGSWVIPSGMNSCQITLTGGFALSCGYVLSSASGASTLSVTMTGSATVYFAMWEIASTNGSFAFDTQGSTTNGASSHPSGQALTLTGTSDVIFQSIFVPGGTSSVSLYPMPYITGNDAQFFNAQAATAALLNTVNGTPPQWANEQNSATVVTGIAFKTP